MGSFSESDRQNCLQWLMLACQHWLQHKKKILPGSSSSEEFNKPKSSLINTSDLNVEVLKMMAYVHGLEPLLHDLSRKEILPKPDLPHSTKKDWEKAYFGNIIQNIEYLDIFSKILNECEKRGLSIIALKGLASTANIYSDIGLRIMADIDILCKKKDLRTLSDIAYDQDFQRQGSLDSHHLIFYHQEHGFPVEFHFTPQYIVKNKNALMDLFWERRQWVDIDEIQIPVLSMEDQLIFELGHVLDHSYMVSLKHHLDFAAKLYLSEDKIDWHYLSSILSRTGMTKEFSCLCAVLSEMMSLPLEIHISSQCTQQIYDQTKGDIYTMLISTGFDKIPLAGSRISSYTNLFQKMGFTLRRFFPSLTVIQATYKKASVISAFLAYPYHVYVILLDLWKRKKKENASSLHGN